MRPGSMSDGVSKTGLAVARHLGYWSLLLLPALACPCAIGQELQQVKLFDSGTEGYPRYRIPSVLVAPNGDVLAFCEGRKDGGGFTGNIDLVMKRSRDGGKTWGPLQTVADDGPNTFGYPVPVVERQTRTLWLLCTRSRGDDVENQIVQGTSKERTRVFVLSSPDSGVTWSKPLDISATTRRPEWTWYGIGSGIGIQLKTGRLVIPAYHNVEQTADFSSHMIVSDDQGKTWKLGGDVGGQTGECQVAERRDGSLVVNARNQTGQNWKIVPFGTAPKPEGPQYNQRLVAESRDAGTTWGKVAPDSQLYEPICQGTLYAWPSELPDGKPLWLFSNPAGPGRRNMTIRVSRDEGQSWPIARRIHDAGSEYSCLTRLPDGSVGCLYERWEDRNVRIWWARMPLAWLLAGDRVSP